MHGSEEAMTVSEVVVLLLSLGVLFAFLGWLLHLSRGRLYKLPPGTWTPGTGHSCSHSEWNGSHVEPADAAPAIGHVVLGGPEEIHSACGDTVDVEGTAECPMSSDD